MKKEKPGCCPDPVIKQPNITKFGQGTTKTISLRMTGKGK